jgi:hypothetical protein
MVSYSTWMVSYITLDGEIKHTEWVKIIAGTLILSYLLGDVETFWAK